MSSEFRLGYNEAKPTSRVLKPPGGGSSNIFAAPQYEAGGPAKTNASRNVDSNIATRPEPRYQKENVGRRDHPPPETNRAINIITGLPNPAANVTPSGNVSKVSKPQPPPLAEPIRAPPAAASNEVHEGKGGAPRPPKIPTPSTRVSQPPGGRCSQLW